MSSRDQKQVLVLNPVLDHNDHKDTSSSPPTTMFLTSPEGEQIWAELKSQEAKNLRAIIDNRLMTMLALKKTGTNTIEAMADRLVHARINKERGPRKMTELTSSCQRDSSIVQSLMMIKVEETKVSKNEQRKVLN